MQLAAYSAEPTSLLSEVGLIGRIPVRNLWLLMLYASDLYQELNRRAVAVEDNPDDIADLVAEILVHATERRLWRNLTQSYETHTARLHRVRGRIDLLATERHQLLARGQVQCRFDHLTVNTLRNRYVRAALTAAARLVRNSNLRHRCASMAHTMHNLGVTGARPSRQEMSGDQPGRNDIEDRTMVAAARLLFELALPTEISGDTHLVSPDRTLEWVRKLYEKAVAGFYRTVLPAQQWQVRAGRWLDWQIESQSVGMAALLPGMETDIELISRTRARQIVIDTKFNEVVTTGRYNQDRLRSGYIYQMYAYLMSQVGKPTSEGRTEGVLLHPSVGCMVDEAVQMQGLVIRFLTVDLAASPVAIRGQLLEILSSQQIF